MGAPVIEDQIVTKKGDRLWVSATVHDWTGSTVVYVQDKAAPALYGCSSSEEVIQKARDGTLLVQGHRFNLRGVLRQEDGKLKKFVADMGKSPLEFRISSVAMRATKGLATITTGAAQAAPVERIVCDPMQGLCLRCDDIAGEPDLVPCFRVYILVTGTQASDLDPLQAEITDMKKQAYCVTSRNAKCMLSTEKDARIDLMCYCDFGGMLTYRLDTECALVSVTNVEEKDGRLQAAVEHVDKVSNHQLDAIKESLDVEWKTSLTSMGCGSLDQFESPAKPEYWTEPARKVRRLSSDPQTPKRG